MRKLIVALIEFYQRYISPYKGFKCAHAYLHGGDSCSASIKKIIIEHGVLKGYTLVRHRFAACRQAHALLSVEQAAPANNKKRRRQRDKKDQRAWCDSLDCADLSCELGSSSCPDSGCDIGPCDCSP
ncbi:MAG TPA: membrane protein insertion efficiency factor YidD [Pseudomonadales bacterium]|nr:membrane protein insertion efficiency factor YidD [Pseudomonadales bacterium]